MKKYLIWTIGCQMNKADSEKLGGLLETFGFQQTESINNADIIVLNSCVVRQKAEDKVIRKIQSLKGLKRTRPEALIALTGCMVAPDSSSLKNAFPFVDFFFPPQSERAFEDFLSSTIKNPPAVTAQKREAVVSAFVPIIYGCDNFCSYCIVPYRRGRERSRPSKEILEEVHNLVNEGTKEVILLGQNVDSYGQDLPGKPDLSDLLHLLNPIEGLQRIRFLTSHPKDMSERIIDAIARLGKVCEQVSLPLQSGDDEILQKMRRGYKVADYLAIISRLRSRIPGVAISTDIIVGFPGESEEQFQHTADLIKEVKFDTVHIAAYSSRSGTIASKLIDDVPQDEKAKRFRLIEEIQERVSSDINAGLQNREVEVLVEGMKSGKWSGRTRTDKLVFFNHNGNLYGRTVTVQVNKTSAWSLQGELVDCVNPDYERKVLAL